MPTTSTTSLAGLLSPPTALSNCFIPVKYVFLLTCGFATPTIFKTVFSREYDPHTPIRLGLIALSDTDAGDNTGTMVETREVFLSRAGALLASTGLWKVGGAWHRVHFEIEGE